MKRHGYTVILVPHTSGTRRSVRVTRRRVQIALAVSLICSLGLIRLGYGFFRQHETSSKLTSAERANEAMLDRIETLESRNRSLQSHVDGIHNEMTELERLESRVRELAGLDDKPADTDDKTVALGGRGGRDDTEDNVQLFSVARSNEPQVFDNLMTRIAEHKETFSDLSGVLETERRRARSIPCIHPTDGPDVWTSSSFAWRTNPFTGNRQFHNGIDFAGPIGTPIIATGDGEVVDTGWNKGLGWFVVIDHGFGYKTRNGHCEELMVEEGDMVKRGDIIAKMGSTGRSTGPHVHYEVLLDGKPQNPVKLFMD